MAVGVGFEPTTLGSKPSELPLLQPTTVGGLRLTAYVIIIP